MLPSERELADHHGVSRMTARQALSLLESEVWSTASRRGTFVAEPRVRFHIGSFSEEVSRLGGGPRPVCCGPNTSTRHRPCGWRWASTTRR